ncbi:MAG: methylglutaconyl-CoA hydratase, partial [Acidobacteria bacterium]
ASACDLVLAARASRFGYPEVKIGFVPTMVMAILRRNVSEKRAFELVTLGNEISAEEAVAIGLVNRLVDDEAFDDEVDAFVQQFTNTSSSAVSLAALQFGVDANVIARISEECQKGIARFLMKE